MTKVTKVLVVDDHPLFRAALETALVKSDVSLDEIQTACSIEKAIAAMSKYTFSLILLDLNLSDSQDFEGFSKIRAANDSIPIIVVSATESKQAYATALSLGARGYIPKSGALPEITKAISNVLSGGTSFPEINSSTEIAEPMAAKKLSSLTPAQHRVMNCLSNGLLNKQIAYEMNISEATVKAHMTAIFRKLGANNRTQALLVFRNATIL